MQEVVIVAATRTAIGSFQGSLAGTLAVELGAAVIRRLLYMVVDVVVHVHNDVYGDFGRHITELWYEPKLKRAPAPADA